MPNALTLNQNLRSIAPPLACAALCWVAAVAHSADFLDVDKAYVPTAKVVNDRTVEVHWRIAPGYYLYRERAKVGAANATLGALEMPKGMVKHDPNLDKDVEIYHDEVVMRVPVTQAPKSFTLNVTAQGCAEAGLCYPPYTVPVTVSLKPFGGDGTAQVAAH